MENKIFRILLSCESEVEVELVDEMLVEVLAPYSNATWGRLGIDSYKTILYVDGLIYDEAVVVAGELDGVVETEIVVRKYAAPGTELTQQGFAVGLGSDNCEVWLRLGKRDADDLSGISWNLAAGGKNIQASELDYNKPDFELVHAEIELLSLTQTNNDRKEILLQAICFAVESAIAKCGAIHYKAIFKLTVLTPTVDLGAVTALIDTHHGTVIGLEELGDKTQLMAHITYEEALLLKQDPLFAEATMSFVELVKVE